MQTSIITILLATILALFAFEAQASPAPVPCVQCNPVPQASPGAATCDITTSCITVKPNGQYHCACRAGYKSAYPNNDGFNQYRIPFAGEHYRVFVRPGVACNTLCDHWQLGPDSCAEVGIRQECS